MTMTMIGLMAALSYQAPEGWVSKDPSSSMRLATWELPGEGDPVEVTIFYFGPGDGGTVEANLERWYGQFEQPDGSSTKDRAEVEEREVNGLAVTVVDISGTYVAAVRPGSTARNNKPDHRMLAAVVEGEGGPWFIRALGPEATVEKWEESFDTFLGTLRLE